MATGRITGRTGDGPIPSVKVCLRTIYIPISVTVTVKFTLTIKMGCKPILSIKQSVTIDTMMNFHNDNDEHRHTDGKCKQAFIHWHNAKQ